MAIITKIILLIFIPALLVGCAATPPSLTVQNKHTPTHGDQAEDTNTYPPIELNDEILYQALLAEIAVQRGHYDVAVDAYLQLAHLTRDPRLIEKATRVALFARNDEAVLEGAKLWFELDQENIAARQAIAAAYIRLGEPDKALEHLEYMILSESGDPANAYMLVTSLLSREQDVQTALLALKELAVKHEKNEAILYTYGQMAIRADDPERAYEASSRLLLVDSKSRNAIFLHARVLLLQGKLQEAVDFIAKKVKQQPKDIKLRIGYARTLVDAQRFADAVLQFEKIVQQSPDNVEALFSLGVLTLQRNNIDDAEKYLERVSKYNYRQDDVNFTLGQIQEKKGAIRAAIQYYSAVMGGENLLNAHIRVAILTVEQDGIEPAREQLHLLQQQLPSQKIQLYLVEGEILRQAGMYEEAMAFYNTVLEEMPQNMDLLYSRATIAESIDKLDVVEQDLSAIIEQSPEHVDALNALGYVLANRTTRYQEAHNYIEKALELRPQDNAIIDSMGWVLYRLGRYQEAVEYLQRSLSIRHDPEVAAHLGEVLWVIGEQDEARDIWENALKQSPGDKNLLEIMGRFVH